MRNSRQFRRAPDGRRIASPRKLALAIAGACAAIAASHPALGQTSTGWTGASSSFWNNNSNWDNGAPDGAATRNLFFGQGWHNAGRGGSTTANNDLNPPTSDIFRITFENISGGANQTFTLTGNSLTLYDYSSANPGIYNNSDVVQNVDLGVAFNGGGGGFAEVNSGTNGGTLSFGSTVDLAGTTQLRLLGTATSIFNGAITSTGNSGTNTVAVNGAGNVVFNGANTYTGDTFVNAGTLQFALGGSSSSSVIRLGDTGGSNSATFALTSVSGGQNVGSTFVVRSGSSGSHAFKSTNTSGTNTWTGSIYLDTGLAVSADNSGGTLALTGAEFDLKNQTATFTGAGSITISNVLKNTTGSGKVTMAGSGVLTLSGTNTYGGLTTINSGGTIKLANAAALGGAGGSTTVASGAVLDLNGQTVGGEAVTIAGSGISSGGVLINSDASTAASLSGGVTLSGAGASIGGAGSFTLSGAVSGSDLTKVGTGVATLSNSGNSYANTIINAGTLSIADDANLGTIPPAATPGAVTLNGGALRHTSTGVGSTFIHANRGIAIGASGGTIDISGPAAILLYGGNIAGSGNTLTKTGPGTLRLSTSGYTFSKLVVTDGLYQAGADTAFGAVSFSGLLSDAITLNGGGISSNGGLTWHANRGMTLGASGGTINTASSGTFAGIISGTSGGGLIKTGASTLTLSGVNTYDGSTRLDAGVTALSGTTSKFGNGAGALILNGGTLTVSVNRIGANAIANPLTILSNSTIWGGGTLSIELSTSAITSTGGQVTISSTGTGTTSLRMSGSGFDFSRPIVFSATGGGTAELALWNATGVQTYSGILSGNGFVRRSISSGSAGTTIFSGANTYSGNTTLNDGTLGFGINTSPSSGAITSGPIGLGNLVFNTGTIAAFASGGARVVRNPVTVNSNFSIVGANDLELGGAMGLGSAARTITISNSAVTTFSGVISGTATPSTLAFTKAGAGDLVLSATNTYTGITTVSGGTLRLGATNAIPSTSGVNVSTGTATWDLNGFNNAVGTLNLANGTVIGPGMITLNGAITASGVSSISTDVNLNSAGIRAVSVTASGDRLTISGAISGGTGATLNKQNSGTLILSNGGNTFGDTIVNNGILRLGVTNALPTARSLTLGTSSTNGIFDLFGFDQTLAGLTAISNGGSSAGQRITNNAAAGTSVLTMNNDAANTNADFTFAGVIQDGASAKVALTKSGSKVLTLTGVNTYTGDTTIADGTLAIGSTGSIATSPKITVGTSSGSPAVLDVSAVSGGFTVAGAQTLEGHGTIVGDATIAGTVAPGTSVGKLSTVGSFTLQSGATALMEIDGDGIGGTGSAGTNFDQVALSGSGVTFTPGGATLNVIPLPNAVVGQQYPIVKATGGAQISIVTIFANLPEDTVYDQGLGIKYKLNYSSGEIDLTFTSVPEPTGGVISLIAAGGLLARRRRCAAKR